MAFGAEDEIKRLKQELKADPENPHLFIKIANLFERSEKWLEASSYWEKASQVSRINSPEIFEKIKIWNTLKQQLEDLNSKVLSERRSAADTLGCLRDTRSLYRLVPLLCDLECQWHVSHAIRSINSPAAGKYLIRLLEHSDHRVRSEVVKLLGFLNLREYSEELIQLLQDEHFTVVKETVVALGSLNAIEAIPDLIPLLKNTNISIRHAAVHALGKFKDPRAIQPLLQLLRKKTPSQIFVLKALIPFAEMVALELIPFLKNPDSDIRNQASETLCYTNSKEIIEMVCQLLDNKEPEIRLTAIQTLVKLNQPETIPSLQKLLSIEKDRTVQQYLKSCLVKLLSEPKPRSSNPTPGLSQKPLNQNESESSESPNSNQSPKPS